MECCYTEWCGDTLRAVQRMAVAKQGLRFAPRQRGAEAAQRGAEANRQSDICNSQKRLVCDSHLSSIGALVSVSAILVSNNTRDAHRLVSKVR